MFHKIKFALFYSFNVIISMLLCLGFRVAIFCFLFVAVVFRTLTVMYRERLYYVYYVNRFILRLFVLS